MRDPLYSSPPAGPDLISWGAAALRALHPLRWGLGLAGIAVTVAITAAAQCLFDGQPPRWSEWFNEPGTQAQILSEHLNERSIWAVFVRVGPVAAVVAGLWSLIGGWIARHEILIRHRSELYTTPEPIEPGPTALVTRRLKDLILCAPLVLLLCAGLLLPVTLAGLLNHLGGVGAILVAVCLPVVLLANLVLLLMAMGLLAWPLMPVTIAAEASDTFDALSRGYNYSYMRPVRFALLLVVTMVLSTIPVAGVLTVLAGPVENWLAWSGHPAVWAAAGLSASVFWSLQTLVYLHLRTSVDATDANELASDSDAEPVAPASTADVPKEPAAAAPTPTPSVGRTLLTTFMLVGLMVATWVVTAKLFARVGGENAGWLAWGVGERFRPDAEGLYYFASLLAAGWGFLWVTAPVVVTVRRALRRDDVPASSIPTG